MDWKNRIGARPCVGLLAAIAGISTALAAEPVTKFWNLTGNTITHFYLAPAGTSQFGPDQTKNDSDGTVESDERLKIVGVTSGRFDAKFVDEKGRHCVVPGVEIKAGEIFSIKEADLKGCTKG